MRTATTTGLSQNTLNIFRNLRAGISTGPIDGRNFRALHNRGLVKGTPRNPQVTAAGQRVEV
jgi:hypothetical protein